MKAVSFSNGKKNLHALSYYVSNNSEPAIIVNSNSKKQTVLISLDGYLFIEETAYLLSSPVNRNHLKTYQKEFEEWPVVNIPNLSNFGVHAGFCF